MSPSYINNKNPKFLEIDGIFFSGIIVIDYYREYIEASNEEKEMIS